MKELRGFPQMIRIICGEYRLLLVKSKDYKKLLFLGVFHRREGYIKALEIYKEVYDRGDNNDILPYIPPQLYNKLKKEILAKDRRIIQDGRF